MNHIGGVQVEVLVSSVVGRFWCVACPLSTSDKENGQKTDGLE